MTSMSVPASATPDALRLREQRPGPNFLTAPFHSRTWREHGYLWLVLLLAPFAFAYAVLVPSLAAGLVVTVVGLGLVGALVLAARGWGAMYRGLARTLLDQDVAEPHRFVRPRGFWRSIWAMLGDLDGWRALLFMLVAFPVAIAGWVSSITVLGWAVAGLTYWEWYQFLPQQQASDGTWHRGAQFGYDWYADTPGRLVLVAAGGLLMLLAWPWVQHLFALLFRVLTHALLGPSRTSERVAELRASRAASVEDADARLRRIERDLHDGTQARLVAVAMQLGEARDQLSSGDATLAAELLQTAHTSTKEALTELREIARGIHPPALDSGLPVALETLAARSAMPVQLRVDPAVAGGAPLTPATESIAYYTVAELLTNAAKHSAAHVVRVDVDRDADRLRLRVHDDGDGGAVVVPADGTGLRTGLAGLVERVHAVDGTFDLSSPVGGPTVVTVTLPAGPQR